MLLKRLELLTPYQVKLLTQAELEEIYALQKEHPAYHAQFLAHELTKADVLADLTTLPAGVSPEQKFYLGFYEADELILIVDLVLDYPKTQNAFLGLVIGAKKHLGQGKATKVMQVLRSCLKREGYTTMLASSLSTDENAKHFLKCQGFLPKQETMTVLAEKTLPLTLWTLAL